MSPSQIQSVLQAGIVHHRAGRLDDAEKAYRSVRLAAPKNFHGLHMSGLVAYQQGRIAEAVDWLTRAHRIDRKAVVCEMRLALALMGAGRTSEAEAHLRQVVALKPDFNEGWDNLGYCLKTQDRLPEALVCHEKAVTLKPDHATGWYNYGLAWSLVGRPAEALRCHDRALAADPKYPLARFGRAQALQQLHRNAEAVADYGEFLRVRPGHHEALSFRLFALHYLPGVSREQLFAEHVAYGRTVSAAVPPAVAFTNPPEPTRRLRLGILSPDLRMHSCAYFIEPLLRHLDPSQFEVFLYHDHFREDALSARLQSHAASWKKIVGVPAREVEALLRADQLDLLVDLAGHTGASPRLALFARRLAPVQISYLGYPDTTGLPAMDYRLTDAWADPVGEADRWATEKLVRLGGPAWTYQPPVDAPELRRRPRAADEPVTFGCFNNLSKITDEQMVLWGRVLAAVPGSRLLVKGRGLDDAGMRADWKGRLTRAGLDVSRVALIDKVAGTAEHLALYHRVDVALDTFPYHGTTTTCEALWMGVPVVTLAGDRHMSRVGVSLLRAIGHPEWVASTADDYVRVAAEVARATRADPATGATLRRTLAASPLMDHAGQAAHFGAALRACWMEWCGRAVAAA